MKTTFRVPCACLFTCLLAAAVAAGCGGAEEAQPPVATPSVTISRPQATLGSPIDVTYRFEVAPGATFDQDYRVLVHFLDGNEELMWADDHEPPRPTSTWKPGETIEYTRTVFIPLYPYIGEASVQIGMYKDQRRLPLNGQDSGQRAYKVATLQLAPHAGDVVLFRDGWHPSEVAENNSTVEWQWTRKLATLSFRNPRRDVLFYLHADNPAAYAGPQTVRLLIRGEPVDTFTLAPQEEVVHKTPITAAQLGDADSVELTLEMEHTWIPANVPAANSRDDRELGLRVFHAFVEPR